MKSPAMTGQWEAYLKRVELGEAQLEPFIDRIEEYVRSVVQKAEDAPVEQRKAAGTDGAAIKPSNLIPGLSFAQRRGREASICVNCWSKLSRSPRFVQIRKRSVRPLRTEATFYSSCQRAPANQSAINCPDSRAAERPLLSVR